ncbi:hypothetical protein STSP2_02131 [Anaerohalosphaera lusitana]|uniref:Uncharacterized protein n=1 Tax=Anaerohalosphaera lusitana TaxID=1936003 RepID=A0A1U9NMJ2_9BACT|nr:hypothetical protein [Anaerohalosphaera lusitana]AQT68954.1 hypothetical protein STSP2_02131 [Anaerohalosphaera lusitana]
MDSRGDRKNAEDRDIAQSRADIAKAREMIRAMKAGRKAKRPDVDEPDTDDKPAKKKGIRSFEDIRHDSGVIDAKWEDSDEQNKKPSAEFDQNDSPDSDYTPANSTPEIQPEKADTDSTDENTSSVEEKQLTIENEAEHEEADLRAAFGNEHKDNSQSASSGIDEDVAALEKELRSLGFADTDDDQKSDDADKSSREAIADIPSDSAETAEGDVATAESTLSNADKQDSVTTDDKTATDQQQMRKSTPDTQRTVPKFNLAEQILAEQRKKAGAKRIAPTSRRPASTNKGRGTLGDVIARTKKDTTGWPHKSQGKPQRPAREAPQPQKDIPAPRMKRQTSAPVLAIVREKSSLSPMQQKIIADIVERDIRRMCKDNAKDAMWTGYNRN